MKVPSLTIEISCGAVLFDMDGTLVDSTACVEAIWTKWAQKHSIERDHLIQISHGRRTIDTVREIAPHLDVDAEVSVLEREELGTSDGVVACSGAKQLLATLKPHRWAVVTSAGAELATFRMRCAGLPIPDVLISADDVSRGKPDPEGYLEAARRLEVSPEQCVVVEDTPAGVLAGLRAGMRTVAVITTFPAARLSNATWISDLSRIRFLLGD